MTTWTPEDEQELTNLQELVSNLATRKQVARQVLIDGLAAVIDEIDLDLRYGTPTEIAQHMTDHADKLIAALQPFATKEA
ncbi:hypothetical protein [Cupriavidus sp. DL-D2]|uniref:hypothetical protein n=1 Tax=Cupriavidus sp. DL-D2 TaxID=3144974 RepID=UPI003212C826